MMKALSFPITRHQDRKGWIEARSPLKAQPVLSRTQSEGLSGETQAGGQRLSVAVTSGTLSSALGLDYLPAGQFEVQTISEPWKLPNSRVLWLRSPLPAKYISALTSFPL